MNRRAVLTGSVAVLATLAVGACATSEDAAAPAGSESATRAEAESATPDPTESGSESASASEDANESEAASADGGSGEAIAGTGDFPVGGGVVVTTDSGTVVVTHPTDAEFKAFNGRCPHQGCPVSEVTENTIVCKCHGSTFDGTTGDRLEGPAPTGLQTIPITVEGNLIYVT